MGEIIELTEKASIDWNNYLTSQEVNKFLSKDDKVESAEEIIYNTKGDFYNKYFKDFKKQGWTKRELTQDLANFFYNGHLITENKEDMVLEIEKITNKCIKAGLKDKLKEYTIPCMRDYQLKFNPTADNRKTPWVYLVQEIRNNGNNISWELQEFIDTFIKAANDCYKENSKLQESYKKLVLYHNTTNENAIKINKEGIIPGLRKDAYGKGSEAEGSGVWCSTIRGYGYGGATITFEIDSDDEALEKENDTEYMVFRQIKPEEIIDIDLCISTIPCIGNHETVESDILKAIQKYGKEKLFAVFEKYAHNFIEPYNMEQLRHLVETGKKYCKGVIKVMENKQLNEGIHLYGFVKDEDGNSKVIEYTDYPDKKSFETDLRANGYTVKRVSDNRDMYIMDNTNYLSVNQVKTEIQKTQKEIKYCKDQGYTALLDKAEKELEKLQSILDKANKISLTEGYKYKIQEVSRNELLAKTKMQTKSRYKRADAYRGFYLADVDTDHLLTTNTLPVTCRVGDYWDTVELQDVLYWIQYEAEKQKENQVNNHVIRDAILQAVDAMDIKVNCECGDFTYRFAYMATKGGYKYGKPENRPAKITNPNDYRFFV